MVLVPCVKYLIVLLINSGFTDLCDPGLFKFGQVNVGKEILKAIHAIYGDAICLLICYKACEGIPKFDLRKAVANITKENL